MNYKRNLWKIVGICSLPLLIGGCEKKVEATPEQEIFRRHVVECYTGNLIISADFSEDMEGRCKRKEVRIYVDNSENGDALYGLVKGKLSDNPGWGIFKDEPWIKCDNGRSWDRLPVDKGKSRLLLGEICGIVPDEDKEAK